MNKKVALRIAVFILSFLILAGGFYLLAFKQKRIKLKTAEVRVGESSFIAEIADTLASRTQGLSGRERLGENQAMLFVFPIPARYSFWMKGMNFPLDIIWIRDGRVVGAAENIPPAAGYLDLKTYAPPDSADAVLELNAGAAKKFNIKIGEAVNYRI